MSQFSNVTVIKQANIYDNGKVTSRELLFNDGSRKTLGIMLPGEYSFTTDKAELMEILTGELSVQLAQTTSWQVISAGQSFSVPAQSSFKLRVSLLVDYCCSYLD
ncbi:pyrimidine/purine nucleoside phosphorylase [Oceanisphaera avium]|uniref:Pyrimidine/purine nucleoside phosphorylase n=1 Tax=Oceanisphaera avium TaxID=1903694 RepID=A0A1Y0CV67_9GAMM|nr:pyrimidine/purine nucleoside phosphorylase [Oceanisphaera avium]ART79108.1 hypothetical protein CBP12_02235 [Oceanisphaera avium]